MDELQDVCIPAGSFDLVLGNLFDRFGCSKQNVESNGASIESGFLRHKSQLFAILLNVEIGDLLAIKLYTLSGKVDEKNQKGLT